MVCDCQTIDTFPAFLTYWRQALHLPVKAQIEAWAKDYMCQWPELLEMQLQDYCDESVDWRQVAGEKVFPFLGERLPAMRLAHRHLLRCWASIYCKAQEALGFESEAMAVIYVGIGCGAGWATTYRGFPAVLFGLENIAECGWSQPPALTGLVAHEIGHLAHYHWRRQGGLDLGEGPWWQLYEEGFAQRCEHVILGADTWHPSTGLNDDDWLDWCHAQRAWLAAEFLRRVDAGESVRALFGSWFDIRGRKQCGYFLGHELIRELERRATLSEIALLEDTEGQCRHFVEAFVGHSSQPRLPPNASK
jgi:hypothetical protein